MAEECRGDDALRREVERLLQFHDDTVGEHAGAADETEDAGLPESLGGYRVLRLLGRGGMGVVYLARRGDDPPVALKVLRPGSLSPALLTRFHREAETLSRLDHPGISRHLESGLLEAAGGAQPYFAMEFVDGEGLRAWAARPRTLEERLEVLARVCDAVRHAHEHGIIHRDLKPENVLVRADGSPCVLDFGVAHLTESDYRATTLLTATGVLVGTIRYMSPEQADARPGVLDARSDVYSLGVVAHEMVSGRMPYEVPSDSIHRALLAVLMAEPEPLPPSLGRRRRPLESVIGKALEKEADGRYANAGELAEELRRVATGRRPLARPRGRRAGPPRLVLALAGAALAAFAAGQWLGGQEWFRSAAPVIGREASASRRALALLDSAAVLIFTEPREDAAVQAGIGLCDSSRRLSRTLRQPDQARVLGVVAWGLAMQAHLHLADKGLEPGEYEACLAAGDSVLQSRARRGRASYFIDVSEGPLREHLARRDRQNVEDVMSLAASRLAGYSRPWTNRQRALALNERAFANVPALSARGGDEDDAPEDQDQMRSVLRCNRGILLARAAALADSGALAREAIRLVDEAHDRAESSDRHPRVQQLFRSGYSRGVLARIEARPALFDSSLERLSASVGLARSAGHALLGLEAALALAEVHRARAGTRHSAPAARADLAAAGRVIEAGLAGLPGASHPRAAGLLRLLGARIQLDRAALGGEAAPAESALAELASLEPLFPSTTHPVVRSDIELERARGGAILWTLTGDRFLRDAARRRLEAARRLVPPEEDPARARRIAAGLEALRDDPPRAASLRYPVPAVPAGGS